MGFIVDAGNSVKVGLADGESITINTRQTAIATAISGLGLAAGAPVAMVSKGTSTFGPFPAGVVSVQAFGEAATVLTSNPSVNTGSTLTGSSAVGGTLTAKLPAGTVGTIQFTRTSKTVPPVRTAIAGATANGVNTLNYVVQATDANYTIGFDVSARVNSIDGYQIAPVAPRQVATRATYPTEKLGGSAYLFHSQHRVFEDQRQIQLIYSGRYSQLETAQDNGITMALRIEYPVGSGILHPMTFANGATTMTTTAAGQDIVTEMVTLPFTLQAGTVFRIRGATNTPFGPLITTTGSAPMLGATIDLMTNSGVTAGNMIAALDEDAATWNARVNSNGNRTYAILPSAIIGFGGIAAIAITGDSRSAGGSADFPNDTDALSGIGMRMVGKVYPFINLAQSGEKASAWVSGSQGNHRRTFLKYCQGWLGAHGTNDVPAETSAANLIALDAAMKSLIGQNMGAVPKPSMSVTLPPNTGDTTSRWDTLASQNPATNFAFRNALNDYRLAQQGEGLLYDKVFDAGPLARSPSDINRWDIAPSVRTLAVNTTAGSNVFDVTTGTLSASDDGLIMKIIGSGASGANVNYAVEYVSPTQGRLRPEVSLGYRDGVKINQNAVTAVTGAAAYIGMWWTTNDGIHENQRTGIRTQAALQLQARL